MPSRQEQLCLPRRSQALRNPFPKIRTRLNPTCVQEFSTVNGGKNVLNNFPNVQKPNPTGWNFPELITHRYMERLPSSL